MLAELMNEYVMHAVVEDEEKDAETLDGLEESDTDKETKGTGIIKDEEMATGV
jgi:hypothetical protein